MAALPWANAPLAMPAGHHKPRILPANRQQVDLAGLLERPHAGHPGLQEHRNQRAAIAVGVEVDVPHASGLRKAATRLM